MTTTTTTTSTTARHRSALYWTFSDVRTLANRNLIALFRTPTLVVFAIIQPIMFVLLFRYVFGGAIHITGTTYVNYLIPGILVQTVIFGSVNTAIGLAEDLQKGLIERFKALRWPGWPFSAGAPWPTCCAASSCSSSSLASASSWLSTRRRLHPLHRGVSGHVGFAYSLSWDSRSLVSRHQVPRPRRP